MAPGRVAPFTGALTGTTLVATALVVAGAIGSEPTHADDVVYLLGFLVMALTGCVLVWFRPRHAIGWVFVAGGAGTLLAALLRGLAAAAATGGVGGGWLGTLSLTLYGLSWIAVTTLPLLLFPEGVPGDRWSRFGVRAVAVLGVVVTVAVLLGASPDPELEPSPLAIPGGGAAATQTVDLAILLSALITVASAGLLAARWRRSTGLDRRRLAWLGCAALLMAALLAMSLVGAAAFPDAPGLVGAAVEALEIVVIPLAMLAAILDARLFDIDVVFRRSLVYGALIGLVVTVYATAIAATTAVMGRNATVVGTLVASVPIALALTPVKDWLSRQVESRLYGARRRPAEALALVGRHVEAPGPSAAGRATLEAAAQTLGSGLRLDGVRITVDDDPPLVGEWRVERAGRVPPARSPVEIPLTAFGARVGTLEVSVGADDVLSENDLALLRQLAPQIGLIGHSVRTAAALQHSRERIVGAREAERLRLRRDLHDGLGPALAGLTLQVEAVGACVATDPDHAVELNARVAVGLRAVIEEVRTAVDGLRPAELDQLGLAGALAEQARSLSSGGLVVRVECDVPAAPSLPAATEVAAYRIASEALANTLRHAEATSCLVRVVQDDSTVVVRVEDDGRGVPASGERAGVGLESMRMRAEEIGGRFTFASPAGGGTVVEAVLPLATPGLQGNGLQGDDPRPSQAVLT